jgi:tetratricopeptide (TPR) repeat protein
LQRHPDDPAVWDGVLTGLDDALRFDELVAVFRRLPEAMAADRRFVKHAGRVAQEAHDYQAAVSAYRRGWEAEPYNKVVLYRLGRMLQLVGKRDEAARLDQSFRAFEAALTELRAAYRTAKELPALGARPYPALYHRLAELREHMGRRDEACAWHRLVVRDRPDDPVSVAALQRLK